MKILKRGKKVKPLIFRSFSWTSKETKKTNNLNQKLKENLKKTQEISQIFSWKSTNSTKVSISVVGFSAALGAFEMLVRSYLDADGIFFRDVFESFRLFAGLLQNQTSFFHSRERRNVSGSSFT